MRKFWMIMVVGLVGLECGIQEPVDEAEFVSVDDDDTDTSTEEDTESSNIFEAIVIEDEDTDTSTDTDTDTDSDTDMDSDSDTDTGTEEDTDTGSEEDTDTDTGTEEDTDTGSEEDTDTDTGTEEDTDTGEEITVPSIDCSLTENGLEVIINGPVSETLFEELTNPWSIQANTIEASDWGMCYGQDDGIHSDAWTGDDGPYFLNLPVNTTGFNLYVSDGADCASKRWFNLEEGHPDFNLEVAGDCRIEGTLIVVDSGN